MKTPRHTYLTLDALSAEFGTTKAVDSVTLEIGRGELVTLLGPSGCGKTTTLRMIAGFVTPTEGRILIADNDVTRVAAHRRKMGVVFQSYALFPHLTVIENVAFGLRMRGQSTAARRKKAGEMLDLVSLAPFADRYPSQLSGGQQQRVALARALVIEPDVLLLDEPLSNLDAHLRAEMRTEIRALQQRLSITTVFVTHDQAEALATSDRIAVMNQGRVVEIGTPQQLCDAPSDSFTASFLGARTVIPGQSADEVFSAPGLVYRGAPAGAKAIVLRASRLRLSGKSDGQLSLIGTLKACTYLGDSFEVDVETAAASVRVLMPSHDPLPPIGSSCAIEALPGGISFIT